MRVRRVQWAPADWSSYFPAGGVDLEHESAGDIALAHSVQRLVRVGVRHTLNRRRAERSGLREFDEFFEFGQVADVEPNWNIRSAFGQRVDPGPRGGGGSDEIDNADDGRRSSLGDLRRQILHPAIDAVPRACL